MHRQPSRWSIIWADNPCVGMITTAPLVLFIGLMVKLTGTIPGRRGGPDRPVEPEVASIVLACAVALILFLSAIVASRVSRVRDLFDRGREIEASVRKVTYYQGGARQKLNLEFELNGVQHQVAFVFLRSKRTPAFSEGTRIPVLVDPGHPKRVVPLALYGDPATAR